MSKAQQIAVVRYVNFGPFVDSSIDFSRPGLTGIDGRISWKHGSSSNGAGKSFLLDGISWCLWGRCLRADYKGDDVIRITSTEGTFVEVSIAGGESPVTVTRYRKHPQNKSRLLVRIGGVDASRGTDDETQQLVNHLLGMDFSAFQNSVAFGAREDVRSFYSASDSQRKEVFNQILGLSIYAKAEEVAKRHNKAAQVALESATAEVERLLLAVSTLKDARARLLTPAESAALKREIESLKKRLDEAKTAESAAEAAHAAAKKARAVAESARDDARRAFLTKQSAHSDEKAKAEKSLAETGRGLATHKAALTHAENQLRATQKSCSACGQAIPENVVKAQRTKLEAEISGLRALVETSESEWAALRDKIAKLAKTAPVFDGFANIAEADAEVEARIAASTAKNATNAAKLHLQSRSNLLDSLNQQFEFLDADIRTKESELLKAEDCVPTLQTHVDRTAFWVEGFGNQGLRSFLIEAEISDINRRATGYAQKLLGVGASVAFDSTTQLKSSAATREKLSVSAKIPGCTQSYAGASKGQKRRLDLALLLAFRDAVSNRASGTFRQFFADELFDGLDPTGTAHVVELLKAISKDCPVALVTHDERLRSAVDRVVTVCHAREYEATLVDSDPPKVAKPVKAVRKVVRRA